MVGVSAVPGFILYILVVDLLVDFVKFVLTLVTFLHSLLNHRHPFFTLVT